MKKLLALISAVMLIAACVPSTSTPAPAVETIPSAPTGVTATAISKSVITVAWAASSGATSYKVYNNAGVQQTTNPVSVTGTTANIEGLNPHAAYTYKVTAVNGAGESGFSSTANDTTFVSYSSNIGAGVMGSGGLCTGCHDADGHQGTSSGGATISSWFPNCVTNNGGDCSAHLLTGCVVSSTDMCWSDSNTYRVLIRDWVAEGSPRNN